MIRVFAWAILGRVLHFLSHCLVLGHNNHFHHSRSYLTNSDKWLTTDVGYFENISSRDNELVLRLVETQQIKIIVHLKLYYQIILSWTLFRSLVQKGWSIKFFAFSPWSQTFRHYFGFTCNNFQDCGPFKSKLMSFIFLCCSFPNAGQFVNLNSAGFSA